MPISLQITEITKPQAFLIAAAGFVLVLVVLAVLALFIKFLSATVGGAAKKETKPQAAVNAPAVPAEKPQKTEAVTTADAPAAADAAPSGYITLDGVSEQDAAAVMAITAFKLGKSVENLNFSSIKRLNQDPVLEGISEQDAAVIMAITANKLNKPLENLDFKSIRLVEE